MQSWVLLQGVGRGGKERGTCSCQDRGEGGTGTVVTWPSELSSSESCWVPQTCSNTQEAAANPALEMEMSIKTAVPLSLLQNPKGKAGPVPPQEPVTLYLIPSTEGCRW